MNGTGTLSTPGGGIIQCPIQINTAGTITLSGYVYIGFANVTFTYTAGTLVGDGTEVLGLVLAGGPMILHLPTSLSLANLTLIADIQASSTVTLDANKTLTITGIFTALCADSDYPTTLQSSSSGTATNLNITGSTLPAATYITAIDINSSGGNQVLDQGGLLTRCTNWTNSYSTYGRQIAFGSV
jgi:hypothetical protein